MLEFIGTFEKIHEGYPAFKTLNGNYLIANMVQVDKVRGIPQGTRCSFKYSDSPSYIKIEGDIKIIK